MITGISGEEQSQVFICAEGSVLLESKSIKDSIIDLISIYYIFDISYPKCLNSVLLFFQHYVFNLKDQQPLPNATAKLVTNLQKLWVNTALDICYTKDVTLLYSAVYMHTHVHYAAVHTYGLFHIMLLYIHHFMYY